MPEDLNSLLNAYLDGHLSPAQRAKVASRLKVPAVVRRLERIQALRSEVRAALPEPSAEQSRRMWAAIHGKLSAPERSGAEAVPPLVAVPVPALGSPAAEAWYSFFTRPWMPQAWGAGLLGAAAALAWVLLLHPHPRPLALGVKDASTSPEPLVKASAPLQAGTTAPALSSVQGRASEAASAPKRAEAPVLAALPRHSRAEKRDALSAPAPASAATVSGPTEVEQALADNKVDDMIDQFLAVRQQAAASVVAGMAPSMQPTGGGGGTDTVAYQQTAPVQEEVQSAPSHVLGSKDSNGFWNWNPAAVALNQRDWSQARAELQAASNGAGEAAERAFANSALSLLSEQGGPLEGTQPVLPPVGDLRVLSAGTWQLLVESRLARFGGGVSVSLPGLREDGDSFLLDLTFDRGEFAPGAHFVRVSGESPVRVFDAAKQPVSANDFYAPSGADYDIADHELHLR